MLCAPPAAGAPPEVVPELAPVLTAPPVLMPAPPELGEAPLAGIPPVADGIEPPAPELPEGRGTPSPLVLEQEHATAASTKNEKKRV
jgi:hypothetical protein